MLISILVDLMVGQCKMGRGLYSEVQCIMGNGHMGLSLDAEWLTDGQTRLKTLY